MSGQDSLGARQGNWTVDRVEQVAGLCLTQLGSQAVAHWRMHLILLCCQLESSTEAGSTDKIRGWSLLLGKATKGSTDCVQSMTSPRAKFWGCE